MATPPAKTVESKDLSVDSQRALELLKALSDHGDLAGRKKILTAAGGREPPTPRTLAAVTALFARLDMPLSPRGIGQFKAERGLGTGTQITGAVAKAYVRALDGGEVLFRIERTEELELRPADRACLTFLRTWSKTAGAEPMGRLKEVLGLGNPPVSPGAQPLMNEYVGAATVREVSRVTTTRGVSLTSDGLRRMVEALEAEKAGTPAPVAAQAPPPAARPMTATSMPSARARPAAPSTSVAPAAPPPAGPRTALSRRPS
jgi:hypothetical protein